MAEKQICILGAGLTGLSAGWHLRRHGIEPVIFEKESHPGGLCRSKSVGGFIFDYDGHLLHCRHRYTLDLISRDLGIAMSCHERSAWVYTNGVFCKYPFQANLFGLPARIVAECLLGFIDARRRSRNRPADRTKTFDDWIRDNLGAGIAKHFMVPYNTKFWTVAPSKLNCDWLSDYVPVPSLNQLVEGSVEPGRYEFGYNKSFLYPCSGGIGRIADAFARQSPAVNTGCRVEFIDHKRKIVRMSTGRTIRYHALVTTIPMAELSRIMPQAPAHVRRLVSSLRWNSILNINLGTGKRYMPQKHWIYFPEKAFAFFRVGFYHNISGSVVPPGKGGMYVEISYSKKKPIDKKKTAERAIAQLRHIGLIGASDGICCRDVNDIEYGYPLYDMAYCRARAGITEFLHAHDIIPAGRYGSWRYFSMEDSILDGRRAAETVRKLL